MKLGFRKSESPSASLHTALKNGLCFTHYSGVSEWRRRQQGQRALSGQMSFNISSRAPSGPSTASSPGPLSFLLELYPRQMRDPPILLHQRRQEDPSHLKPRWFPTEKEGIDHNIIWEKSVYLQYDRRNKTWLKFQRKERIIYNQLCLEDAIYSKTDYYIEGNNEYSWNFIFAYAWFYQLETLQTQRTAPSSWTKVQRNTQNSGEKIETTFPQSKGKHYP